MAEFVWCVSNSGYFWERDYCPAEGPVVSLITREGRGAREYHPLADSPALFRDFAALECTRDSCLKFADRYGHLTAGVGVVGPDGDDVEGRFAESLRNPNRAAGKWTPLDTTVKTEVRLESAAVWYGHVVNMRRMIELWEASASKSRDHGSTIYGQEIVLALRHRVMAGFDGTGALTHVPTDLLAALWLQFARAVGGEKVFKACRRCGEWFETSKRTASATGSRKTRRDKTYCGDECRMSANYARKSAGTGSDAKTDTQTHSGSGR